MKVNTLTLQSPLYPESLRQISDAPRQLYYIGDLAGALSRPRLSVVGSRKVSAYGKSITLQLAREAAAQGVTIISGLALGVDGLAHQAALEAKGVTIAVLPSGLSKIYPSSHHQLAEQILGQGGALVSEYPDGTPPFKTNFVARNRIISALGDALLITEAAVRSGSLHTANFALEQGKTVMAVPGNITSQLSTGTNNLIKTGATPVTELRDILAAMDLQHNTVKHLPLGDTDEENVILVLMSNGISDGSDLLYRSKLVPQTFNQALTMLEITGKIRPLGAGHWGIA